MQLRPRQRTFVSACIESVIEHGNTLGVAPTGAGKTVMLSAVAKDLGGTSLILQHRDELVSQNRKTFKIFNPSIPSDVYNADRKRWAPATFAMVQTLVRDQNLTTMPPFDNIIFDEAHHAVSPSQKKILARARELNSSLKVLGLTATPMRADKKALGDIFTNVADVITLPELIQSGHLVKPRTFVIDCGLREELKNVRVTANDFDMGAVEKIMDKYAVNERVFAEWQRVAGNRTTVIFCSTVEHASHVTETFRAGGITAEMIEGEMSDRDRTSILKRFDQRKIQVLVNVAVLTEGWDCQHVGCVLLLRPCSHKSTMLQMIGRGLRKVDPERYPGVFKDDCIVLDFGYSLLTYGNLDIEIELTPKKRGAKQWPCPGCATMIPASVSECPICGLEFNKPEAGLQERGSSEREALSEFIMTEVELLEVSPYRWEEFWDGLVTIVNALTAWACCIFYQGRWYAVAGRDGERIQLLTSSSERLLALASSDDFLREHGDSDGAKKSKSWLSMPASQKQLQMLGYDGVMAAFGLNRYRASCELTWKFNEKYIKNRLTAM